MNRDGELVEPRTAADVPSSEVDRLQALADERAALLRVAELVARAAPAVEVFDAVTTEASLLLHGQWVTLAHFDADHEFAVVASHGGPSLVGVRSAFGPGSLPDRARRHGTLMRVDDYGGRPDADIADRLGVAAAVAAPVHVAGAVWGMFTAASQAGPVPPGTEHRLEPFARLVAAAVGNSQAHAELRALADEQAALRRVAELAARGASPEDVLAAVAVEGSRLSGVDFTTLLRYEADGSTEIVAVDGAPAGVAVGMRAPGTGDGAVQRLWRTGRAARVDDLAAVPGRWPRTASGAGFAASVAVPVLLEGALWGALVVVNRNQPLPRGTEDRLARFADTTGIAISAVQARLRLRAMADEQAALRRVAELVARGAAPDDVFVAVSAEASALLGDLATELLRFEGDEAVAVAACNSLVPLGLRVPSHPGTPTGRVLHTGLAVRADTFDGTPLEDLAREVGLVAGVAVPVVIEGRVRAALTVSSSGPPLPLDVEARLTQFAELAAVAIANAEANAKLTASRARVVATADETRRRLQRDVHDGAQQRLVHAVIALKMAGSTVEAGSAAAGLVEEALTNVERASSELRDIVHGILPASLLRGGLSLGLESLVADLTLPVDLRVTVPRLPATVETTAYFIVAEALTNAVKHSKARSVDVVVDLDADTLVVEIRDDGVGGADPLRGTGLTGLLDRVEAAAGALTTVSPAGSGTVVRAELPVGSGGDREPPHAGATGRS